jgi:hypothetical protein
MSKRKNGAHSGTPKVEALESRPSNNRSTYLTQLPRVESLPRLIEEAASALANARTAAEVLDARDRANVVYVAAKMAARLAKAKDAHDTVIAACRKAQADALVIEAQAQCRLADEYDAAQERGEAKKAGKPKRNIIPNENNIAAVDDIGLTSKQVHEARIVRDAEKQNPGVVRKTVEEKLQTGEEPTRADVKRATTPKPRMTEAEFDRERANIRDRYENPQVDVADELTKVREEKRALEIQIVGLEDEIDDLKVKLKPLTVTEEFAKEIGMETRLNALELIKTGLESEIETLRSFCAYTIMNIDIGALEISGDPERMRKWNDLKARVEPLVRSQP